MAGITPLGEFSDADAFAARATRARVRTLIPGNADVWHCRGSRRLPWACGLVLQPQSRSYHRRASQGNRFNSSSRTRGVKPLLSGRRREASTPRNTRRPQHQKSPRRSCIGDNELLALVDPHLLPGTRALARLVPAATTFRKSGPPASTTISETPSSTLIFRAENGL
jgi:hypothetical protein